jgi:hypothetical protein
MLIIAMHAISRIFALFTIIWIECLFRHSCRPQPIVAGWGLLWVGRIPSLEYPILELLDLALNGYMLAKPKQCLALKQFGAFMFMLHIGELDLVEISTSWSVDIRRLIVVVNTLWRISCLCSLQQRCILRTNTTLMAILPVVRFGNVQRCV